MSQPTPPVQPGASNRRLAEPDDPAELYRRLQDAETSNQLRGDLLQQVSDAVLLVDHDQRVVFLNAAAERRYGYAAADAVGQPLTELYTYRWLSPADEAAATNGLRERGEWRGENIHVTRDGRELHVESIVSAWRDASGAARGLVAVVRDITARKRAEAELRASEALFRATFEESQVPQTQLAAPSGRYLRANRAFCEFLGYTFDELLQMTPLDVTASDDLGRELVRLPTVLTGQSDSYEHEKRYRRKDGRIVWGHVTATLLRDADGRPERTVAVIQDITARKEMEAAVFEADRRKDQFLATLAHELRNPLAPIRTGLALLRARDAGTPDGERIHAMMERQTVQLVRLIDDLLDVSRITTGKLLLQKQPLQIGEALHSAIETVRPLIEQMGHQLHAPDEWPAVTVYGDPVRLAQVFGNLLNNAAKYTPRGGTLQVTAAVAAGEVRVSVIDNGIGIEPDQLPHVFTMFSQVESSRRQAQGGLGIGLALAKQLVDLHGGQLEVRSPGPGFGATFSVILPLAEADVAEPAPMGAVSSQAAAPDRALRVLVVDDNRDAADSLSMMTTLLGHETRTVYDGESALAAFATEPADVVLLDLGLPGVDGFEVCRRLRTRSDTSQPFVVAVTGWGASEDRRRVQHAGFDQHLVKPVDPRLLGDLLTHLSAG